MSASDRYHFHQDCYYWDSVEITEEQYGQRKLLCLKCPAATNTPWYRGLLISERDLRVVKDDCRHWKPKQTQMSMEDSE